MEGLPLTLAVAGRRCLVVGGGAAAARRIELLLRTGAEVHVVAPRASPEVAELAASSGVRYEARRFSARDLDGAALVIAATAERATNAAVSIAARRRGVPVNVVDDPALCTVTLPAIVDRGPVAIAISTGGAAPTLARQLRARVERVVPGGVGDLADFLRRVRPRVRAAVPDPSARRRLWDGLAAGPIADLAMAGRAEEAERLLDALLAKPAAAPACGKVYLVGAGPGDPELLTLKAARLLQEADAVVHDRLVGAGVLDLARREAERVDVGKRCGRHSTPQAEINARLVSLARAGKCVVRLKGGDPFVFGRGGEEMQALMAAGVACEIVPGVTAALGCAAYAGIPLTHRDHAHACVFVTGHSSDGALDLDWASLARPLQTVCVYMGLGSVDRLVAGLVRHGVSPRMPAAIVVDGTTRRQQVLAGRLGELTGLRREVPAAAAGLVIVGEVVALRATGAQKPLDRRACDHALSAKSTNRPKRGRCHRVRLGATHFPG